MYFIMNGDDIDAHKENDTYKWELSKHTNVGHAESIKNTTCAINKKDIYDIYTKMWEKQNIYIM